MTQLHAVIVDDNRSNVRVLAELLTLEDVEFTEVLNATQLPEILDRLDRVDVIFLDLEMPDIDGYTILEYLKDEDRFQAVPIVAYTVHVGEISHARQLGFHSFLGKPLDVDRFPHQLTRILNGERVWAAT